MKETIPIESLWKHIVISGISDIQMGLEFVSYFFILKEMEERSFRRGPDYHVFDSTRAESCHWSMIKQEAETDPESCCLHLRTLVARWLRSLDPESCLANAERLFVKARPESLYSLLDALDTFCTESLSMQDAFESVLVWAEREGAFRPKAGQIMTPMHIAYLMAALVRPQKGERVIDLSCGTGNLLVAA